MPCSSQHSGFYSQYSENHMAWVQISSWACFFNFFYFYFFFIWRLLCNDISLIAGMQYNTTSLSLPTQTTTTTYSFDWRRLAVAGGRSDPGARRRRKVFGTWRWSSPGQLRPPPGLWQPPGVLGTPPGGRACPHSSSARSRLRHVGLAI